MENVANKRLYNKIKLEADKIYERPSLYKSLYILKEYRDRGGTYKTPKPVGLTPTERWLKEKWVKVSDWLEGKNTPCGEGTFDACRPTVRIDKTTPITLQELQARYGLEHIRKKVAQKLKNPTKNIRWG